MVNTHDKNLPRILLIGDSHVEAYFPVVLENLKSLAYCCKFTTSRSLGDPILIDQLHLIFKQFNFDVICFNNGLHGYGFTEKQYGKYIPAVYRMLKKHSNKAIVWVNTTGTREKGHLDLHTAFNERVIARNKLVADFSNAKEIPLIDSYDLSEKHPEFYSSDGVHFNQEGIKAEAGLITEKIKSLLK